MVDISVEKYTNAKVCTIRVSNKKLFWVRMHDVQEGRVVKNMFDLVRKEIWGIFRTKNPTKDQIRKYKRREKELDHNSTATFVYAHSDLMSRIIKNCRGKKKKKKKRKKNTILVVIDFGCKFIRVNPDAENYDIFVEIGKIKGYIAQSNKEAEIKEIKEKLEKETEADIKKIKIKLEKELKDKNKELKKR